MDDAAVQRHGLVAGSAGPVGLSGMRIVADDLLARSPNLVTGANKPDLHLRNVNYGRDWQAEIITDLALAREAAFRKLTVHAFNDGAGGNLFELTVDIP
jgi:prolyl-tRNA synthetase